jgi:uncharacterized membrane protein
VSWFYLGEGFIIFGVLHCIGLSIILSSPLLSFRISNLLLGLIVVTTGIFLQAVTFDFPWLLWLGFIPSGFYTVDYFPLFPWLGVVLIGVFIGNTAYSEYQRRFVLPDLSEKRLIRFLSYLGRHSLLIYFLHQPIIIALIHLIWL